MGLIASIGVAATDVIASQIVGQIFGDGMLPGDLMGGGMDGLDLGALDGATHAIDDDVADIAEDTMDEVKDGKDSNKEAGAMEGGPDMEIELYDETGRKLDRSAMVGVGAGAAVGAVAAGAGAAAY